MSCLVCVEDGILLLEANRILRAGGYFLWVADPVNKDGEMRLTQWKGGQIQFKQWIPCSLFLKNMLIHVFLLGFYLKMRYALQFVKF